MQSAKQNRDWVADACAGLIAARGDAVGWGYRPGAKPFVEPTALVSLALLASASGSMRASVSNIATQAAEWLTRCQAPNGAVGLSDELPNPHWPTPYAVLLWSAVGGFDHEVRKALDWLLRAQGKPYKRGADSPVGHDTTLVGWPWVEETHSWVEPTALAVIALRCASAADHDRTRQGIQLLCDRAIATGGWNYGNSMVFGKALRPRPGPTGLALVALAGFPAGAAAAAAASRYLEGCLPQVHAEQSLGLGLLGLAAWGRTIAGASDLLASGYRQSISRSGHTWLVAYLLLAAAADRALELLAVRKTGV